MRRDLFYFSFRPPRSSRPGCVDGWWGTSAPTVVGYPDAVGAATIQRLLTERDAGGLLDSVGGGALRRRTAEQWLPRQTASHKLLTEGVVK